MLRAQTNAVADAPSAKAFVPLRSGSLDAVQGGLDLRIPLGPRLPGRIPLGFSWSLSINDGLRSGVTTARDPRANIGGSFRPVEWPDLTRTSAAITVQVGGEATTFVTKALRPVADLPTGAQLLAWMNQRGVDTGQTEAQNYAGPYPDRAKFVLEKIYPSSDGTRYFLEAHWEVGAYIDPENSERMPPLQVPKRSVVIMADQAVWTVFNGVSHVTNRWGDHVTVTETGPYPGAPTSIEIKNLADPTHPITLTISNIVALAYTGDGGWAGAHRGYVDATATLAVTHLFDLPTVTMTGRYRTQERFLSTTNASGTFDSGFLPETVTESSDGGSRSMTLTWPQAGVLAPSRLSTLSNDVFPAYTGALAFPGEITYPEGVSETFKYGIGANLGAFSFYGGVWGGWVPFPSDEEGSTGLASPVGSGIKAVVRVVTAGPGVARTIVLAKLWPKTIALGGGGEKVPYEQPKHETYILAYPTAGPLTGETPFKGQRLIHPSGGTWAGGPATSDPQPYAFATGLVLQKETIRGTGGPAESDFTQPGGYFTWLPTVGAVDQTATFDGYDLRSWANPNGVVAGTPALSPVALRTQIHTPNLPTRIIIAGNPNLGAVARDDRGPLQTHEYTKPPEAAPGSGAETTVAWSGGLAEPSGLPLVRTGTITRHWDAHLGRLSTDTDNKTLAGDDLPNLRTLGGKPDVDFGKTTTTYGDTVTGLATQIQGVRGGYTALESRAYLPGKPLVTQVLKSLSGPGGAILANPANASVRSGREYEYDSTAFQWLNRERDLTDGRWISYQRDDLGRETSRTVPPGVTTTTEYDAWGRVQKVVRLARGIVGEVKTEYTYDMNGRWKEEKVTAEGRVLITRMDLDAAGRVTTLSRRLGNGTPIESQTTTYDGWGQKVRQTLLKAGQPHGNFTWVYDEQGRLTESYDRNGARLLSKVLLQPTWKFANVEGQNLTGIWTTVQDARGHSRSEITDLLGQKMAVVDQKGQLAQYWYDRDGHLIQTRQGSQVRQYQYNDMGWMTSRTEPEEGFTGYSGHTMAGLPLSTTQKGRQGNGTWTTTTTLGAWGQPVSVSATGPEGTLSRNLSYDGATYLLTGITESQPHPDLGTQTLSETYGYDDLFRVTSKSVSDGYRSFHLSRVLDAVGNEISLTYPGQGGRGTQTKTTTYDVQGRTVSVNLDGASRGSAVYDVLSGSSVSSTLTFGNNAWTTSKVENGELIRTTHVTPGGTTQDNPITWDAAGLMKTRGGDSYEYDELQRLVSATTQGLNAGEWTTQTFSFDRWGNRVSSAYSYAGPQKPKELMAWSYAPTGSNDLPAFIGTPGGPVPTHVVYDALGRMTQVNAVPGATDETTSWGYDPTGRVLKEILNGASSTFLLDAEGLRFKRWKADGSVEYTLYGFQREPLMVFQSLPDRVATPSMTLLSSGSGGKTINSTRAKKKTGTSPSLLPGGGGSGSVGVTITQPTGSVTVAVGSSVSFRATSGLSTAVFYWNFGNGSSAGGANVSHAFTAAGTYLVKVTASDPDPEMWLTPSSATVSVTVVAPPSLSFTASATTIPIGGGATLNWSSSNASSVTLNGGGVGSSGSRVVSPGGTTAYTMVATGPGGTVTRSITVTVVPAPVIYGFSANPSSIYQGDSSTLSWSVGGATSLSLDNGIGGVSGGSRVVSPSGSTTYILTATNTVNGVSVSRTASAAVAVSPRPTVPSITSFTADATAIPAGSGTTLRWSVTNSVGSVNVQLNGSAVSSSGTQWVAPSGTTTYTLTATNTLDSSKTVSATVTVRVVQAPTASFSASTTTIPVGSATALSWNVSNDPVSPTSVSIDQGVGSGLALVSSRSVAPSATTTYTLTASNLGGTISRSVTITVVQQPVIHTFMATPATIYQGQGATLSWNTSNATSLTVNGSAVTGTSLAIAPPVGTTYTLVASNLAGTVSQAVTVQVRVAASYTWQKTLVYGFGQLISEERTTGTIYIQSDQVGSPNLITDSAGNVVGRSKNLPFGERFGSSGTTSTRRFTNHEDQPGSAIYMQARTYLPVYGKFAQVDPAYDQTKDDPESWNLYNYVTNNPVTKTDPDGRLAIDPQARSSDHDAYGMSLFALGTSGLRDSFVDRSYALYLAALQPAPPPLTLPGSNNGVEGKTPDVRAQTTANSTDLSKPGEVKSGTTSPHAPIITGSDIATTGLVLDYINYGKTKPVPGMVIVITHGLPGGVLSNDIGEAIGVTQISRDIKAAGVKPFSGPIILASCHAAARLNYLSGKFTESSAEKLANTMGNGYLVFGNLARTNPGGDFSNYMANTIKKGLQPINWIPFEKNNPYPASYDLEAIQ